MNNDGRRTSLSHTPASGPTLCPTLTYDARTTTGNSNALQNKEPGVQVNNNSTRTSPVHTPASTPTTSLRNNENLSNVNSNAEREFRLLQNNSADQGHSNNTFVIYSF